MIYLVFVVVFLFSHVSLFSSDQERVVTLVQERVHQKMVGSLRSRDKNNGLLLFKNVVNQPLNSFLEKCLNDSETNSIKSYISDYQRSINNNKNKNYQKYFLNNTFGSVADTTANEIGNYVTPKDSIDEIEKILYVITARTLQNNEFKANPKAYTNLSTVFGWIKANQKLFLNPEKPKKEKVDNKKDSHSKKGRARSESFFAPFLYSGLFVITIGVGCYAIYHFKFKNQKQIKKQGQGVSATIGNWFNKNR